MKLFNTKTVTTVNIVPVKASGECLGLNLMVVQHLPEKESLNVTGRFNT